MAMAGRRMEQAKESNSTMIYRKGSLFNAASNGAVLTHACNASGVWGAGIAKKFAIKYPIAFNEYKNWCEKDPNILVGSYLKIKDSNITITCLFTSAGYGDTKDSEQTILENTEKSIKALLHSMPYRSVINSPRINAGLFKVPWEKTEKIIKACLLDRPDIMWIIWEG